MTKNVVNFPIKSYQRERNRRGPQTVSCIVEERYLSFALAGETMNCGTPVYVEVRSENGETGAYRNLCGLYLTLEELEKVVETIRLQKDREE